MTEAEIAVFRTELVSRRERLHSAAATLPDSPDLSRLLNEVDAALARMDQGAYGLCDVCHDPVEPERLKADPLMRLCLDHLTAGQRRELEEDLDLAHRIQTQLLPDRGLRLTGWEVYYHYEPAGLVSGDYCDLVPGEADRPGLFFLTGDISGKGVAAAFLMSHLHAICRTLLSVGTPMTRLVEKANRLFCESTMSSHYATLVCGWAGASGEIEVCNAGHCPPLVVRSGRTETVGPTGLPVGLFSNGQYGSQQVQLDPGDGLLLYSDGLTEACDRSDRQYGLERLSGALESCNARSAQALAEAALTDLRAFLAGARKADDLTLLVIQRAGSA